VLVFAVHVNSRRLAYLMLSFFRTEPHPLVNTTWPWKIIGSDQKDKWDDGVVVHQQTVEN
jgi:hypothetical protein